MKTKWKLTFLGVAGVVLLIITVFNLTGGLEAELLEVKPQTIANTFQEEGKVVPRIEMPIYTLNSQKVIDLPIKEGQEVKKGDALAVLDTIDLEFQLKGLRGQLVSTQGEQAKSLLEQFKNQVSNLELELEKTQLELTTAQNNLYRTEELYNAGALTQVQLEEVQKARELAEISFREQEEALKVLEESFSTSGGSTQFYKGRLTAIEAQIQQLEYQIENSTIRAPINGTLANLKIKKGELATMGTPLMSIFQKDSYLVEVFVLAQEISSLERDMEVNLILSKKDGDVSFTGIIKEISPSAEGKISALGLEEQRVKIIIEISSFDNTQLFPELRLDVVFTTDKQENQLVVPKTALFPYQGGEALWVVENDKAKVQAIKKGFETDRQVVIEEGLKEGDLVILNPQLEGLKEGKRVK